MKKLFKGIGKLVANKPVKILLVTIVLFAILITGVTSIKLATGNETLVQSDNEIYISNEQMEDTFGGDSILILFTDDTKGDLLSLENIEKMWELEQRFQYEENIFSFMSVASIVHQITEQQSIEIRKQLLLISEGLENMSSKLIDIGNELTKKELMDPQKIEEMLNGLSNSTEAFNNLINAQDNLTMGLEQLKDGLLVTANGLGEASNQIKALTNLAGGNQELIAKLNAISGNIKKSSLGIKTMGEKSTNFIEGTENTSTALTNISSNLTNQTSTMQDGLSGGIAPEELKEMATGFIAMGENLGDIASGLEVFHSKSSMMIANIPGEQSELDLILYDENNELRPVFSDVIIDDYNNLMVVKLQGNLEDEYKDQISKDLTIALENEEFKSVSYIISGKPVLDSSLRDEMQTNMMMMVGLAVLIMFLVLSIVFKVKWKMLSLGIIMVSVVATLGFMGILSVPITMVSMAVFPILIGLGIDYSIQFHNRYEEEKSVKKTISQIGKAIAIAVFATVLGFISLYASPVPMIQDFGKMLTIGVIISFIGSMFLLLPILHFRDKNNKKIKTKKKQVIKENALDKMLKFSTRIVIKLAIPILIIVIGLAVAGFLVDSDVGVETDIETFMPQDMEALTDIHTIRDTVGSTDQIVVYIKDNDVLTDENASWIQLKTESIENDYPDMVVGVKSIDTLVSNFSTDEDLTYEQYINIIGSLPENQVAMFVNEDRTQSIIIVNIKHLSTDDMQEFITLLTKDTEDTNMEVMITGKSALDVEMVNGLTSGRVEMTIIGLILVFLALLLIYRNIFKALIPIIPVGLIIGMSSGIMYLLDIKFTPITATLGALVLGMGTEMTVMLLERYLEERKKGKNKVDAMIITVTRIGKAIVASGLTTVGGFSVLMASEFIILRDFGLMTVVNISLALFSTFIVLPPIIILFDRLLFSRKEKKLLK
ncbi:MAG: MMPL family transporter [Clostridiales bacterium]|nr:MMPL family transporter [Clostridiales bacterium]